MITLQFARALFAFMIFGAFTDLQLALFSALPGPLANLYNQTFIRHYGIELDVTAFLLGITSCAFQGFGGWLGSAELFVVGQLLLGLSIPIKLVVVTLFVTECAPDEHRGFASVALHLGDMLASLLMCILMYLFTVSIPDSPKWLVRHGDKAGAAEAMRFYHGEGENPDKAMTSLCLETHLTTNKNLSIREAWHDETIKEAMKVIMILQLMFTISPVPLERAYSVVIHTSVGFSVEQSLMLSWMSTLLMTPLTFLSTFAIDKFGRRPVVFIASSIMFLKILVMFTAQLLVYVTSPSWVTMVMATANEFASDLITCTGAGAVASLLIAELIPPAARVAVSQASAIICSTGVHNTDNDVIPGDECAFCASYLHSHAYLSTVPDRLSYQANTRQSISERTPLLKSRAGSVRSTTGVHVNA
ncbi:unnamed protein product [Haemonchus placei]|uniref:MFS domain-containing protein n=1 Tax=Haemonchus placei TaxID=6290 RepID=A0A0N4WA01_HAEPC|nr:unnamed protein product [Haemonchus placei]